MKPLFSEINTLWNYLSAQDITRVRVYWNLHKKVYSVQDAATRVVVCHAEHICLRNVTYKVSEAGRQRVLAEQRKNVHAFLVGEPHCAPFVQPDGDWHYVRYDPYERGEFYNPQSGEVVQSSDMLLAGHIFGKPTMVARETPCTS